MIEAAPIWLDPKRAESLVSELEAEVTAAEFMAPQPMPPNSLDEVFRRWIYRAL